MNNSGIMRFSKTICELRSKCRHFSHSEWSLVEYITQTLAFYELHRKIGGGFGDTYIIDGNNVGMIQSGSRTRFLFESRQAFAVFQKFRGQNFQCNFTTQSCVASAIDFTKTTCANRGNNFVRPDFLTTWNRHRAIILPAKSSLSYFNFLLLC